MPRLLILRTSFRHDFETMEASIRHATLQRFVEERGHALVSRRLVAGRFARFGECVSIQRKAYSLEQLRKAGETVKKGRPRINNRKVALLEGVGFEWVAPKDLSWWNA